MKTYLFDFDGTLVDSMPTYVSAVLRILDEHSVSYGSDIVKILTPWTSQWDVLFASELSKNAFRSLLFLRKWYIGFRAVFL